MSLHMTLLPCFLAALRPSFTVPDTRCCVPCTPKLLQVRDCVHLVHFCVPRVQKKAWPSLAVRKSLLRELEVSGVKNLPRECMNKHQEKCCGLWEAPRAGVCAVLANMNPGESPRRSQRRILRHLDSWTSACPLGARCPSLCGATSPRLHAKPHQSSAWQAHSRAFLWSLGNSSPEPWEQLRCLCYFRESRDWSVTQGAGAPCICLKILPSSPALSPEGPVSTG